MKSLGSRTYRSAYGPIPLPVPPMDASLAGFRWRRFLRHMVLAMPLLSTITCPLIAEKSGIDLGTFDRGTRVQDDLYQSVNGVWLRDTEIPADKSDYGSFTMLDDLSAARIRAIIEEAASGEHPAGSDLQKVGDLYRSFMDESLIEAQGTGALRTFVDEIRGLSSKEAVFRFFGKCAAHGITTPVGLMVDQDDKNSTQYITMIIQRGTSLPDRDYYLKLDDEKFAKAREALKKYIDQILTLRGEPTKNVASEILELETKLAEIQWPRTVLRDAEKRYNKKTLAELSSMTPSLDWKAYFAQAEIGSIKELNVATPSFFEGLAKIIDEVPLETWKHYLEYMLFDDFAPYLPKGYDEAHFELHSRVLAGIPAQKPRWERGVDLIAGAGAGDFGALGDIVGRLYVERHFSDVAKQRMDQLVKNLLKAYDDSIGELTWMTDATKERARQKLAKITTKIGFTTKWRVYDTLTIQANDLIGNIQRSRAVEYHRMIDKLGQPVDREEWGMTPQTVNAYYNPSLNEIVFPAAILQPPFFDETADDAVNYGGIGAVIGHEISHAFDDQGSKYDADGNLKNWWSPKDLDAFKQITEKLVDQYDSYSPLPGRNVNGELTLGENIADLSGLSIALKAYKLSLAGKPAPTIDGFTGDQRFFLGWSQVWRRKYRDEELVRRLMVDPHSPSWYRTNGPVINIDAFYEAFGVQPSDRLYRAPAERIRIW
jgi:putative endopeptidase